jgi:hypothetical protein
MSNTVCPCCKGRKSAKNQFGLCSPCYREVAREMRRDREAARGSKSHLV